MMSSNHKITKGCLLAAAVGCLAIIVISRQQAGAEQVSAKATPTFEVLSTERIKRLEGIDGSISWEDNETATGLILLVKVTAPEDIELWAPDFCLAYGHGDTDDDRSRCTAMTTAVSSLEDEGVWLIRGEYIFSRSTGVNKLRGGSIQLN